MIKYSNEKDKCYGVVGMAVGMTIWNAEEMFIEVSLDESGFDCLSFTRDFLFIGDPAISPTVSWQHRLNNFRIMMGITISNVLCRSMVLHKRQFDVEDKQQLIKAFVEMGDAEYSLSESECMGYFNKSFDYLVQVYNNRRMQQKVKEIAKVLSKERKMCAGDICRSLSEIIS